MSAKTNYYLVVIYRLFVVLFMFFLCRLIFYWLNSNLFADLHADDWNRILKGGLRFDIAAMFYFNGLAIVLMMLPLPVRWRNHPAYAKATSIVFHVCNGLAILLNCIDFIYYRFTLRRTTVAVLSEFKNEQNVAQLIGAFAIDFWYVIVIFGLLTGLMVFLYNRVDAKPLGNSRPAAYYTLSVMALLIMVILAVGGIRGDYKHSTRPITISNAGDYATSPSHIYLVLNTPFTFIRTMKIQGLKKITYFKEDEVSSIYSPVHLPKQENVFNKKNVVLIILESFGKEAVGFYNGDLDNGTYKGFTPFLDSLAGQSKVFWNSFANGRKSIDAIPSCIASIPSGVNPFVLTPYVSDTVGGLGHILRNEGYNTSFFHGAPNGSMGFSAIVKLLGIEHYYGKNEFNNDAEYDGIWGIWDEPFLQYFANKLGTIKEPFFSTFFSVSSHHPFKVPEKYTGQFKKGTLPVFECVGYTDMALQKFFDNAKRQRWFNNTLFVITADHATVTQHEAYQTAWGEIAIPILLYAPGDSTMKGIEQGCIQQIDIMPTVLGYLKYNKPFLAFGNNVLDSAQQKNAFAFQYSGEYRWFQDDYALFSDGKNIKGLFNYKTDRFFKHDIKDQSPAAPKLHHRLKAFIQQYNNRLIENRLTVEQ